MAFNGTNRVVVEAGTIVAATVQASMASNTLSLAARIATQVGTVGVSGGTVVVSVQGVDASGSIIAQNLGSAMPLTAAGGTVQSIALGGFRQVAVIVGTLSGTVAAVITAQG